MINFGTSGFRGIMGDNFTKENLQKVGVALLELQKKQNPKHKPKIAVGFDNRFMGKMYAKWLCEVLAPEAQILFYNISVPTPLICWKTQKFDLGLMITASHNEFYYNGIKVFINGKECDSDTTKFLEGIANSVDLEKVKKVPFENAIKNKSITLTENYEEYCDSLLKHIDTAKIKKAKLKILVNCMHGVAYKSCEYILKKLNLKSSVIINENIDPYFEHKRPAPFVQNLEEQAKRVKKEGFDFGVAFDGDSDRFGAVSGSGKIYDCNFVSAVLYYYLLNYKNEKRDIVKNKALTYLVNLIAEQAGQKCHNSKVGFKEIAINMKNTKAIIGAESNGVAYGKHILNKDGIMAFCLLMDAVAGIGKSFEEILKEIQKELKFKSEVVEFAYPLTTEEKEKIKAKIFEKKKTPNFEGHEVQEIDREIDLKITYKGGFWGMIRFSGTEPVLRIFAEMPTKAECEKMVACYEDFVNLHTRQD